MWSFSLLIVIDDAIKIEVVAFFLRVVRFLFLGFARSLGRANGLVAQLVVFGSLGPPSLLAPSVGPPRRRSVGRAGALASYAKLNALLL